MRVMGYIYKDGNWSDNPIEFASVPSTGTQSSTKQPIHFIKNGDAMPELPKDTQNALALYFEDTYNNASPISQSNVSSGYNVECDVSWAGSAACC